MIDAVSIVGSGGAGTARAVPVAVPVPSAPAVDTFTPPSAGTLRVRVDNQINLAILELRSMESGDVLRQYPTEAQIQAFLRASELEARQETVQVEQRSAEPVVDVSTAQATSAPTVSTAGAPTQAAPTGAAGSAPSIQTAAASGRSDGAASSSGMTSITV